MMTSRHINLSGKKIVVVGLGVSGLGTARYLAAHGARVVVSEINPEKALDPDRVREIRNLGILLEAGGHDRRSFLSADMVVISPGVPHDMEPLPSARAKGIPVTGELELAARLIDTPMIAVTGTNGKTTVTTAFRNFLESAGFNIFMGGNIGSPLIEYAAAENRVDYAVVEVSSFQLDTVESFSPLLSIILNISPDHLDRYYNFEAYVRSKLRIFSKQKAGQHVILNDDDERLADAEPPSGVSVWRYGFDKKKGRHAYIHQKEMLLCLNGEKTDRFNIESYHLPGKHNLENLMAVALGSRILGVDTAVIQKGINNLKGLPNRLEYIGEVRGVSFYNDSKATNVDAAVRALSGLDQPVILIAGGRHKGSDYAPLVRASENKVKKVILLGESKGLLAQSFKKKVSFLEAENMEKAVSLAFSSADLGDAVLLAPACSSFDMFSDYAHRGDIFKKAVKGLVHG